MTYHKQERLLTIEGLSLSFGSKLVLRDINLHVDNIVRPGMMQGQVIALLGLSGSGKTQLFRCIAGMQKPTTGAVRLNDNKHIVSAGEVGVVQQAYPLLAHRTVWDNLMLAGRKAKDAKTHAEHLLVHFGLADKKKSYPIELSGGQRQRIAIIQQYLCSNYFMLMDEPFSGLDVVAKERVYATVRTMASTNELNTLIFTTHDLESAVTLADEIWILGTEEGKAGATVVKKIDLAAMGMAWSADIQQHPQFWPTVQELQRTFKEMKT